MFFRSIDLYNMIKSAGKDLTLTKTSGGAYDPSTGSTSGTSETIHTFKGYLFNNTNQAFGDDSIVRGNRTLAISIVDIDFEPDIGDILTGDADGLRVASVSKIMNGATAVCYLCGVSE